MKKYIWHMVNNTVGNTVNNKANDTVNNRVHNAINRLATTCSCFARLVYGFLVFRLSRFFYMENAKTCIKLDRLSPEKIEVEKFGWHMDT